MGLAAAVPLAAFLTTSSVLAATAPSLGAATSFAVLGASTVTCTGASAITGDVGVSPGSAITGFPPCKLTGTFHSADAVSLQAQANAGTAYNDLKGATCDVDLTGKDLGGMTLSPGVYCFSSSAQLTGTLNLSGGGVYIFQIGSTLTTASASSVVISNAQACDAASNIFWQVGSSATLGTTTAFAGNIIALASITMTTGATLDGRAIALNGAVTMDTNTISTCGQTGGGGNGHRTHCNQGVGNGPEGCDPGNSNQGNPSRSNDELGGTPGNPGRKGGNHDATVISSTSTVSRSGAASVQLVTAMKPVHSQASSNSSKGHGHSKKK